MGVERTYCGDYLINNKFFVEIKPKRLWDSPSVTCKAEAAKEHCKENGWEYRFIDPKLDETIILREYERGNIKFTDATQEKFEKYYSITQ